MILCLDTETTTFNKGNPFDARNKLVCYSVYTDELMYPQGEAFKWHEGSQFYLESLLKETQLIVGFNFKFDLHWLKKEGIDFKDKPIWDVQIAEFVLEGQSNPFPSLEQTCIKYNLPHKLDYIKLNYWDKGIDTDQIPWEELQEYAANDAYITGLCYLEQKKRVTSAQERLIKLMCRDMCVLQEMEANGIPYNEDLCLERSKEIETKIEAITSSLNKIYPDVPINWNSGDHLSAVLYGGTIIEERKVHAGYYKTGARAGQIKLKTEELLHEFPRLFTPLKGSELKKHGYFAVDEGTLRKLKGKHYHIVEKLLELAKLEKLNGTYYKGLPKLNQEMHWPKGILHGQFNQTTAKTGRLSSSKPNLQNMAGDIQDLLISEYDG